MARTATHSNRYAISPYGVEASAAGAVDSEEGNLVDLGVEERRSCMREGVRTRSWRGKKTWEHEVGAGRGRGWRDGESVGRRFCSIIA
jgi:hypothetical protein